MENVLGLEITEDKIRILELGATEKGWEPLHLAKLELPPNCIKEGIITEPKPIANTISAFIKENNIATKKAVALINSRYFFTRIIRLPHNLSDSQIRLNLEAELNQYQIFSGKATVIDFKNLEEISEEGIKKVNLLYAATFKTLTESYLKTAELAGLDLIGVDAPILSVMRLLDEVDLESSSRIVTLLMLLGEKSLEMCILKGNRPRFLHSVEIDLNDFNQDRANFLDRLVSAIRLVVNFYQARFVQGEQITRILINPLDAKCSQIHILLQEKLPQIPIQPSNALNKISVDKGKGIEPDELTFAFSSLLGASLKVENKAQSFNLNLLFEQKAQRKYRLNQTYLFSISLSAILGVMIISLSWVVLKINILQAKISRIAHSLEEPSPELSKALSIREKNEILGLQIDEASSIAGGKKFHYFNKLAKAMILVPKDLWLTDITNDKESKDLILAGESLTEKSLFNYKSGLSDVEYFDAVEITSSESKMEGIKFLIRCKIN